MYATALLIHSWLRWAVLAAGLIAAGRGFAGWNGRTRWSSGDDRAGMIFVGLLDLQLVIGVLLYFVFSPITGAALQDFGGAMSNPLTRFWAVEHLFGMVVGLALAHVGRVRVRKAPEVRRHRRAAIFYGLALVAMLAVIPWPGMPAGRPLFRW